MRLDPGNAQAHFYLGQALREKGDADGAIRELRATVKLRPDFAEAQNALGLRNSERGMGMRRWRRFAKW